MLLGNWDPLNVSDLTWLEVNGRKRILVTHRFLKSQIPGFENSFILDTASQIGVRSSRRLIGEHILTEKEIILSNFPGILSWCVRISVTLYRLNIRIGMYPIVL